MSKGKICFVDFYVIDSQKENIFNETVDVSILKGISDGLYSQIDKLYNLM